MSLALAILVVAAFGATVAGLGLPGDAREAAERARGCWAVLRDPSLDDDAKERRMRSEARRLFALSGRLGGGAVLALALPLLGVWALERAGVASLPSVLGVLGRADFLLATTVAGLAGWAVLRRARRA